MNAFASLTRSWIFLLALCALALHAVAPSFAASVQFTADCAALTSTPHRLAGSPEGVAAGTYLAKRLRALGITVVEQRFPSVQLSVNRCELIFTTGGRKLPLQPMRPNGIIPPVTPVDGITGELVYAGAGDLAAYGKVSPNGKIVVLDYNSGQGWIRAFRLGAQAVIFLKPDTTAAQQWHFVEANANLPRFYYNGNKGDLPSGTKVTLHSQVVWRAVTGKNIIGILPGTNPALGDKDRKEAIVLGINYDSYGEVPTLAKGARGAANCAALLQMAATMKANPPQRDFALVFFDAQAHGHAGSAAFYRALESENTHIIGANAMRKSLDNEFQFIAEMQKGLANPNNLSKASKAFGEVMRRLRTKGGEHVAQLNLEMEDRRLLTASLKATPEKSTTALPALLSAEERQKKITLLAQELKTRETEKMNWNELRRVLAQSLRDGKMSLSPSMKMAPEQRQALLAVLPGQLDTVVAEVQKDLEKRSSELAVLNDSWKQEKVLRDAIGKDWITAHFSLMLGDATPRWGVFVGGDSVYTSTEDLPGLYGSLISVINRTYNDNFVKAGKPLPGFEQLTVDGKMTSRAFSATPLIHSGEIAGRFAIYNMVIGTVQDRYLTQGSPLDVLATLDTTRIESQANAATLLLTRIAGEKDFWVNRTIKAIKEFYGPEAKDDGKFTGPNIMGMAPGSPLPNTPMPDTVVQINLRPTPTMAYSPKKYAGFDNFQVVMSDSNANIAFGPAHSDVTKEAIVAFSARFNAAGYVSDVGDSASATAVTTRLTLFPCLTTAVANNTIISSSRTGAIVLPPQTDVMETKFMQAISNGELMKNKSYADTRDGIAFWYCEKRVQDIKLFGKSSVVYMVMGDDATPSNSWMGFGATADLRAKWLQENPYGIGGSLLESWKFPSISLRSGADMWRLNELRLAILRDKNVSNSSLEELHGRSRDLLELSVDPENSVEKSEALAASSYLASRPVYNNVLVNLDDLVRAVLILLALAIPFAFALERLLIGATNIYRQIGWFVFFFMITFGILLLVHPAFGVSTQPIIIFLAFALIVLSALVIMVIMQKFETELRVLQGLTSTVHAADVSRFSTMMAAMSMGISTMRRRPLRTALTALTITLLTFTILNFASFDTRMGIVTLPEGAVKDYTGVLLHKVNWSALDQEVLGILNGRWGDKGTLTKRLWLPGIATTLPLITREDGTNANSSLRGVLGLDPAEFTFRKDLRELIGTDGTNLENGIFLTDTLAESLGVSVGDTIMLGGIRLQVAGLLYPEKVGKLRDMDNNGILPVDFAAATSSSSPAPPQQTVTGSDVLAAAQNKQEWVELPIDTVVIVSNTTAEALGGTMRVATLYTPSDLAAATAIAEDMARMLPLPVVATRVDGIFTHVLAPTVSATGVKDLIFPILLGGLVIFGTMLGSVADREKEIYTFSALGLAPAHVATLFFAEALVYSFIGGLGGYLLAQGVMKIMNVMADAGLVTVPEMNYSSFNAIITILIVMGTVLASAIYPAIKASRGANPGVLRSWRLPTPVNDTFNIIFPFTVSAYDITGVVSFLKEHFDNFAETGLGVFMARNTEIIKTDSGVGLHAMVALAPFDLGVTQDFVLKSAPSEIPGIDEVTIILERRSGQQKDWERLNKVLLDDLRRQFLIWRSLPNETMEMYRNNTLDTLGDRGETADTTPSTAAPQTV